MIVTDGGSSILRADCLFPNLCFLLLHVTYKLPALHHLVDIVRKCYPDVDELKVHIKPVLLKSFKHIR